MTSDQSALAPALPRLEPFLGEWSMEASFPGAPAPMAGGRTSFEAILDGRFLLQRGEVPHPAAPDVYALISPAVEGAGFLQHYFDSRGVVRTYTMSFADGVWQLVRDSPDFSPLSFAQRFIATFSADASRIEGCWETAAVGSEEWKLDFGLTYIKAD